MDLCRLCTKQQEPLKDLLHATNSNIRQIVEKFTHIAVKPQDDLPTKICLDCEEKLVTFELFLLECQRAQEYFLKTLIHSEIAIPIKVEIEDHDYSIPPPDNEVKSEFAVDDIIKVLKDHSDQNTDNGIVNADDDDFQNSSDYDEMDDVAIASLKKIIQEDPETKVKNEYKSKLEEVFARPYLRVSDLVRYDCSYCREAFISWALLRHHSMDQHQKEPKIYCICGYTITSATALYNHTAQHKAKHKKIRNHNSGNKSQEDDKKRNRLSEYIDFTCKFCGKEYKGWYKLKNHHEMHHQDEILRVSCSCGIALKSKSMIYSHVKDHQSQNGHRCEICHKALRSSEALEKHKMRHVDKSKRQYKCSQCDKVFRVKDCLKSHLKTHIPIEKRRVVVCEICSMGFTTKSAVVAHRKVVHDKVKGFVCDMCGYACGTGGELKQHKAIHSDEKPYRCSKCNKCFKTYSNLKTHSDIHEGTSYVCYICNRVLNSKRTLRKHLLVHEENCKHVCPYCGKAFKRRQTLVVHQHIHTGDKPITCKVCGDKFAYASTLRTHRIRCHPELCKPRDGASAQTQSMVLTQPNELSVT